MPSVYALYATGPAAQRAVDALRTLGLSDDEITVITTQPMEDQPFSSMHHKTPLWYAASAGGVLGLITGAWLTSFTQLSWPLPTGNMPIVAWWPNLIVVFELTMLGAILATVATALLRVGLLRRMPALYDPAVSDGKLLVGVESPRNAGAVEETLLAQGGEVKRVD